MKCVSCEVEIYFLYIIWLSGIFQCAKSAAHLLYEFHAIDVNRTEISSQSVIERQGSSSVEETRLEGVFFHAL